VLPHGCVEPRALFDAIAASRGHPDAPPTLYGGLHFGDYGFLGPGLAGEAPAHGGLGPGYRYVTWQVGPRIRHLARAGRIGVLPLRFRDIPRVFGRGGRLAADVAVLQCAPPRKGTINLGISCSIFPSIVAAARLVIAEIHPDMPRSHGATELPADVIDLAVDASAPLATLERATPDEVDQRIVARVLDLVPDDAWVQLGVGAIPDAILTRLHDRAGVKLHSGMLTDGLLEFLDAAGADARVVTGEIEGSHEMYARAAADPRVLLQPTTLVHDVPHMAGLERFVSINSAIEVDLDGQVNGETIDGVQVSGVGGSLDFVEAARYSRGGRSVIALRSTARGRSRIVDRLAAGTAVTIPRFAVDVVVTEHGVADLAGLDLRERAAALIEIADPAARGELRERDRTRVAGAS
jgi:acyl-CoA hydrolase